MFLIVLIVCSNVIFIILSLSLKMKIKQSIVFPTLLMSRFKRDCVDTWYNSNRNAAVQKTINYPCYVISNFKSRNNLSSRLSN